MSKPLRYKDLTIKAIVVDPTKMESLLIKLGVRFVGIDHQKDTYFSVSRGKLKLRQGTIENLITHYERIEEGGLERTMVYQYDLNPNQEEIAGLFKGHSVIGTIEKERRIYFLENTKIHLDTTPDNKTFIEIEARDPDDSLPNEILQSRCLELKEKLEINDCDLLKTGYFSAL